MHGLTRLCGHRPFVAQNDLSESGKSLDNRPKKIDVTKVGIDYLFESGEILREGDVSTAVIDSRKVKVRNLEGFQKGLLEIGFDFAVVKGR